MSKLRTVLISDSQTCLFLCSRPSSTLDLSTSLIVSRVQDLWDLHLENLFFAPGETFHNNVDLLTRYQPHLKSLLSKEFYRPSFLLPEIQDRVTIKVTNMRKQSEEALPHLCAQQQVWALMKGSRLGPNRLRKPQASTQTFRSGLHSTGTWGLQWKEKMSFPRGRGCHLRHVQDSPPAGGIVSGSKAVRRCKRKQKQKHVLKKKPEKQTKSQEKVEAQTKVSVFSSAALSTFKMSRKRMSAISARSGIAGKRPPQENRNMWKTLLESCRGHTYSVRVLARIISLLRRRDSVSHSGPAGLSPLQKAMWTLFAAERANSYRAIENRR